MAEMCSAHSDREALVKSHGREFYTYSEVQLSGGRIDIVLNLLGREYIIELKMCGSSYPRSYAEGGFQQLKEYMKQRRAEYGYLVVFDGRRHQQEQMLYQKSLILAMG